MTLPRSRMESMEPYYMGGGIELEEKYCEQIARRIEFFLANGEDAPRSVIVRD